jgi:histidinol phosphatase-like enzyme
MRNGLAALALAMIAAPASAQSVPFKLVISWNQGGLAVVDYPNAARCEQARRAVMAQVERQQNETLARLPPGSQLVSPGSNGAFCIPG